MESIKYAALGPTPDFAQRAMMEGLMRAILRNGTIREVKTPEGYLCEITVNDPNALQLDLVRTQFLQALAAADE